MADEVTVATTAESPAPAAAPQGTPAEGTPSGSQAETTPTQAAPDGAAPQGTPGPTDVTESYERLREKNRFNQTERQTLLREKEGLLAEVERLKRPGTAATPSYGTQTTPTAPARPEQVQAQGQEQYTPASMDDAEAYAEAWIRDPARQADIQATVSAQIAHWNSLIGTAQQEGEPAVTAADVQRWARQAYSKEMAPLVAQKNEWLYRQAKRFASSARPAQAAAPSYLTKDEAKQLMAEVAGETYRSQGEFEDSVLDGMALARQYFDVPGQPNYLDRVVTIRGRRMTMERAVEQAAFATKVTDMDLLIRSLDPQGYMQALERRAERNYLERVAREGGGAQLVPGMGLQVLGGSRAETQATADAKRMGIPMAPRSESSKA